MKLMRLVLLVLFMSMATLAWGAEVTMTGDQLTVTYIEPTTDVNGTLLTNLHSTFILILDNGQLAHSRSVAASVPEGGGSISQVFTMTVGSTSQTFAVAIQSVNSDGAISDSISGNLRTMQPEPSPPTGP